MMEEELKKNQRAFIPINIITCVLALIAGLTLIFAPVLTIDAEAIVQAMSQSDGGEQDEDYNGMSESDLIMHLVMSSDVFDLSFTPLDFMSFASQENPVNGMMKSLLDDDFIENAFTIGVGAGLVIIAGISDGEGITKNDLDKLDLQDLSSFMKTAETDEDAAFEKFKNSVRAVAEAFDLELDSDFDEAARDSFDELIDKGTNPQTGDFSLEYFICATVSESADENGNPPPQISTYDELADYLADNVIPTDETDTEMMSLAFYVLAALVLFPAAMWLLLALLSGIHILLKNKTFLTWYVKVFGFIPCLLFGIVPLILGAVITDGFASALIGSVGTLTWISGGCFLALAILSIGFLYPRRRKIRMLKRELAAKK